tara:strand:+ start:140 stop:433 length:294 start_codon:yes stop_codon:yes gene_type:complete
MTADRRSPLERHLQSLALSILVGFSVWNLSVVTSLRTDITQLQQEVAVMQNEVKHLKEKFAYASFDRFTNTDFKLEALTKRIIELDERMGGPLIGPN